MKKARAAFLRGRVHIDPAAVATGRKTERVDERLRKNRLGGPYGPPSSARRDVLYKLSRRTNRPEMAPFRGCWRGLFCAI